ncbi:MAG: histidine kinase [Balneola sp.]
MSFKKKVLNQVVQNIMFWTISFAITLNLFSRGDQIRKIDWIYTFLFHIPFITVVTLNIYQSVPNILKKYNIWLYLFIMSFAGFGVVLGTYSLSYGSLAEWLFSEFYFVGVYGPFELFGIMAIYISASTLIELSKSWFNRKEKEVEIAQLEEEKTKSELKALQAQINPHFLFNSLNTIYGETLKKSEKAPEMILKLSDILRYVVDNMNKSEVQLDQELEYIGKFIDLQKERLSNPNRVIYSVSGNHEDLNIQPLLLITFIENAFKYGSVSGLNERIKITISVEGNTLEMIVENAMNNIEVIEKSDSTGTGLLNTRKRLEFSYPGKYSLDLSKDAGTFKATLNIDLS